MSRRLAAFGTLIWDRIHHPDAGEEPVEQWGGAAYSLAALSAAAPPGWRIEPVVKLGQDLADPGLALLRGLPGVEPGEGVRIVPEPNNRVELRYHDVAHRCEILTGGVPPWEWSELEPLLTRVDAIYLNFISGFELPLPLAQRLRAAFDGPIYADLHSLFLGPPGDGARKPRRLPDAEAWLGCFDAVQMNESELELLIEPRAPLERLLEQGPRLALVTRGAAGARYAIREALPADPLRWRDAPAAGARLTGEVPPPFGALRGDPTGCGDVWGATAFAAMLGGAPLAAALDRAARAAAVKIRHPGTTGLREALASSSLRAGVLPSAPGTAPRIRHHPPSS